MTQILIQFYAELNHFLPPPRKNQGWVQELKERTSIKDLIESLGVPHPEVDCILVNGESVDFSYLVKEGDRIQVYPISAQIDAPIHLSPPPLAESRFVLDVHLGKLAASLRMLGFDTLYQNNYDDEELAQISATENRILLTRDKGLLMRSMVVYGYYVRKTNPQQQIIEVLQHFNLFDTVTPLQRCIRCNGLLKYIEKELILEKIPPKVREQIHRFHQCQDCQQIYWKGSHYQRIQDSIEEILSNNKSTLEESGG